MIAVFGPSALQIVSGYKISSVVVDLAEECGFNADCEDLMMSMADPEYFFRRARRAVRISNATCSIVNVFGHRAPHRQCKKAAESDNWSTSLGSQRAGRAFYEQAHVRVKDIMRVWSIVEHKESMSRVPFTRRQYLSLITVSVETGEKSNIQQELETTGRLILALTGPY